MMEAPLSKFLKLGLLEQTSSMVFKNSIQSKAIACLHCGMNMEQE
jgi:hypothetical protein